MANTTILMDVREELRNMTELQTTTSIERG